MEKDYQQVTTLSDEKVLHNIEALARMESETTVEILLHLNEVRRRRLFAAKGYSSLHDYCTAGPLRYSNAAAHRRIQAAGCIERFPELIPLLLAKEITLCTLSSVAVVLNSENKDQVISAICGRSKRAGNRPLRERLHRAEREYGKEHMMSFRA